MKTPTDAQIKEWAEKAYKEYSEEICTEEGVWKQVSQILNTKAIQAVIAKVAGFQRDSWGDIKLDDNFKNTAFYKAVKPRAEKFLAKALEGYEVKLSTKDITTIRAAYKRTYVETLKEAATHKGKMDANTHFEAIIEATLKDEAS
jgi:hypothetical protein